MLVREHRAVFILLFYILNNNYYHHPELFFSLSGKPSDLFEVDAIDWASSQKLGHSKLKINVKSSQERAKRRQKRELTRAKKIKSVHKKLFPKSSTPVGIHFPVQPY